MATKRLMRDSKNAMFLGVAAGFANYFGMDRVVMRLIFVLVLFLTGFFPIVVFYFIAAIMMPTK
ncbi:MAG: phage shock protein C [Candidatus Woesearchaeota archaeon]|jgi:phage shock protein C